MKNFLAQTIQQKGQAALPLVLATAILTTGGNWLLSRLLNSPETLASSIGLVQQDVAVLKKSDTGQDSAISEMKSSIEYIRRSMEEQNKRQGIVINDKTKTP